MLKDILNLDGVQPLDKNEQKNIKGGAASIRCDLTHSFCHNVLDSDNNYEQCMTMLGCAGEL